jgi:hypothetical protein
VALHEAIREYRRELTMSMTITPAERTMIELSQKLLRPISEGRAEARRAISNGCSCSISGCGGA